MIFLIKNDILLMLVYLLAIFKRVIIKYFMHKTRKNYPNGGVHMSRVCNICGKGQASGNNVSHSNRKTRRTFKVNVQKISYVEDGKETLKLEIAKIAKICRAIDFDGLV